MIRINIITVGKLKEKYFLEASKEYEKRLSGYCKLTVTEITPAALSDKPTESEIESALNSEGEKILKAIPSSSSLICPLCVEGKHLSSEDLSEFLDSSAIRGNSSVTFIIGGSYGLSDKIKCKADLKLSMSSMTFPHRLARIMILEQIYRAFKISEGGTYHK